MTLAPASEDLRRWMAEHLDPLDEHEASDSGQIRSDDDLNPGRPRMFGGPLTPAAVLVALAEREGGLSVILTRRSETLRKHTGQVALPGGRRDPGESAWQTAVREAHEEIGLHPSFVSLVGLSTPYRTGTGFLITPVVGFVRPGFTLEPNPAEVAEIFETPFGFLMDPGNYAEHVRALPSGEERRFYAATHDDRYIWGATAGVLRALYERLYGAAVA